MPGYASTAATAMTRRNKPTFGLVFAQMLDLHILCTLVPRTRSDAEQVFATTPRKTSGPQSAGNDAVPGGGGGGSITTNTTTVNSVKYVTIIEVLLDEMGVWEPGGKGDPRKHREQRWAAVDTSATGSSNKNHKNKTNNSLNGKRIVDAFPKNDVRVYGELRLAAGFGGRRV